MHALRAGCAYTARMSEGGKIEVRAFWDEEAGVWVAESDQLAGLVTEAETFEGLTAKLQALIPELLELNAPGRTDTPTISLTAERTFQAA